MDPPAGLVRVNLAKDSLVKASLARVILVDQMVAVRQDRNQRPELLRIYHPLKLFGDPKRNGPQKGASEARPTI